MDAIELLAVNVNDKTEKKGKLTYLSWAWAWAEVLKIDPAAEWEAVEYPQPNGTMAPCMYLADSTAMVKVSVTLKGRSRACVLPVMDNTNKAIKNPNAFDVNKAVMRCLAKAVSMHGLGLYIYAGEDLPEVPQEPEKPAAMPSDVLAEWLGAITGCKKVAGVTRALEQGLAAAGQDAKASAEMKKAAAARVVQLAPAATQALAAAEGATA